jgi:hypothetical protein
MCLIDKTKRSDNLKLEKFLKNYYESNEVTSFFVNTIVVKFGYICNTSKKCCNSNRRGQTSKNSKTKTPWRQLETTLWEWYCVPPLRLNGMWQEKY